MSNNLYNQYYQTDDYEFKFDKKPEDYFDKSIDLYLQDMVDKYYGNKDKEREYNKAMQRIKAHRKIDGITGIEIIENYKEKSSDLKLLQIELWEDKVEKLARYNAGATNMYANDDERKADEEYVRTMNHAYNKYETTQKNLITLGKYGEKVDYIALSPAQNGILSFTIGNMGKILFNSAMLLRNTQAVIYRGIGRVTSGIYKRVARDRSGIYNNKPGHRYEARKDYFVKKENYRLVAEGRRLRPIRTMFKARIQAITKYKEGNAAVLEAGYQDIKKSYIEKAKCEYFSEKLLALEEHQRSLDVKEINLQGLGNDPEILQKIEEIRDERNKTQADIQKIRTNPALEDIINSIDEKREVIQTDAISVNQHDRANKATITRTITGVKMLGRAGIRFTGPKIKNWIKNNSMIEETQEIPRIEHREYIEPITEQVEVPTLITEKDLLSKFSIKKLMEDKTSTEVSFAYDSIGNKVTNNNLDFFRGAAQEIDGKVISLSDGNGYDITDITSAAIPAEMLTDGSISQDTNLFDILAALQRQAGKDITAKDLIDKISKCGSVEEQSKMITEMTEGLDFWKSSDKTGIAYGWDNMKNEIDSILNEFKGTVKGESNFVNKIIKPGYWKKTYTGGGQKIVKVPNPRIIKALGIANKVGEGMSILDAIDMFFENLRDTKSNVKSNKKEPRRYNPIQKVGFTGKQDIDREIIDNDIEMNDILNEIEDIER